MPRLGDVFRAYQLTISTKGDVSDQTVKSVKKWLTKKCQYVYAVIEYGAGKKHLHAAMYFKDPQDKKNLRDYVWSKLVRPYHPDSVGSIAVVIQVMPGDKWVKEYLHKEKDCEVLINDLPLPPEDGGHDDDETLNNFYPTQEQQDALMAAKGKEFPGDKFLNAHELHYRKWLDDKGYQASTIGNATQYWLWCVNFDRSMPRMRDSRSYVNMGLALDRYIRMDYELTNEEDNSIKNP